MFDFSEEQIVRYSRHIILPEIGGKGQKKLLEGKVLLVGAGGLGSPSAYYLAAAGVGKIGIVDMDVVDLSNLQRQILHHTGDLGRAKTDSAKEKLNALNPDVELVTYNERLSSENIMELFRDYDIIVDGCDNFPTRYLINDACVLTGKVNVHGSIFRFEGQATVFQPGNGPCYRCLYPDPPPPGMVPSCQEAGILGAVAGVIGTIQANEVLKYVLGVGNLLAGRLLVFNALDSSFRQVKVPKDPKCAVCGDKPTITKLIDYEEFCSLRQRKEE